MLCTNVYSQTTHEHISLSVLMGWDNFSCDFLLEVNIFRRDIIELSHFCLFFSWTDFIKSDTDTSCDITLTDPSPLVSHSRTLHLLVTPVYAVFSSSSPLHRRASMLDFYFDHSEERPLEAFEDIFASYESKK